MQGTIPRPGPPRRNLGCILPGEPVVVGASSYVTEASAWFAEQLLALEPGTQWGGTYASKPGYHNTRDGNSPQNYSVVDRPPDDGGPGNKAAGYDWTFPEAQRGDYSRISIYTSRLLASAQDLNDPRLNGWREFYGQSDYDSYVEGWDCRYGYACTSDSSHLWHIHLSESRNQTESYDNKKAMLSVLRGETVAQWLGGEEGGGGTVLTNCPFDRERLDLFYVGPKGTVIHKWWSGGIGTPWVQTTKSEDLGGSIAVGTLTAQWAPNGKSVNVAGIGQGDSKTPAGCGQWWGMNLTEAGGRSGWGSFEGTYGLLPTSGATARTRSVDNRVVLLLALIAILAIIGLVAWWFAR